jgi:hypothetical protein
VLMQKGFETNECERERMWGEESVVTFGIRISGWRRGGPWLWKIYGPKRLTLSWRLGYMPDNLPF